MTQECYHCGDDVIGKPILFDDKQFCCNGCKSVYQLLSENDLTQFYSLEEKAGIRPDQSNEHKYSFLEVDSISKKFIDFEDENDIHVTLYLPKIHCSSCIYLLENLHRINPAVKSSNVEFTKRIARIIFDKQQLSMAELAKLLDNIGYAPNFGNRAQEERRSKNQLLYKLGIAGFAFGSIMLWTFPEYLGIERDNPEFRSFTSYLSFFISIPVLLYSANEYLVSAYKTLKHKSINLDVPISIGIIALYSQSVYNIFNGLGPGYMDSFAGFIFFLLIGKWFQNKSYQSLSFDRDYTSYFPVAVTRVKKDQSHEIVEIDQLEEADKILIRNDEVIPCDVELLDNEARIDYSFVTGESDAVQKSKGEFIYAGGKLIGQATLFEVRKTSSRSHLTQLWNRSGNNRKEAQVSDQLSIYFLVTILLIALVSGIVWLSLDPSNVTSIVVSVLIVACPCALALSRPFTYGNIMRLLGRRGMYLKHTQVIDNLRTADTIVFDKTGTLTSCSHEQVQYIGDALSNEDREAVMLLCNSSTHPLSRSISAFIRNEVANSNLEVESFEEHAGLGIGGKVNGRSYKIGSHRFAGSDEEYSELTSSYVSIDGKYIGRFQFSSELRPGVEQLLIELKKKYELHVLSGDNDRDIELINRLVPKENIHFKQKPADKQHYIEALQKQGKKVAMLGDGINDAGALEQADMGIAVTEDIFRFTPSSDAIIKAEMLYNLAYFLKKSKFSTVVLATCFTFSFLYNIIGLGFAVTGNLTPLIAAILMPISSITVVFISTFMVILSGKK